MGECPWGVFGGVCRGFVACICARPGRACVLSGVCSGVSGWGAGVGFPFITSKACAYGVSREGGGVFWGWCVSWVIGVCE